MDNQSSGSKNSSAAEGEVHVWHADPRRLAADPDTTVRLLTWLTPIERRRYERFIPDRARRQFLLGRGMIRSILGHDLAIPPETVELEVSEFGKPVLAEKHTSRLEFNLTHTRGMIACAVVKGIPVGIDVERVDDQRSTREIAEKFFAPAEVHDLDRFEGVSHDQRFFRFWTLKEAYIKARGLGLRLPLKSFHFRLGETIDSDIAIEFSSGINDNPDQWTFRQWQPSDGHILALAIRRSPEADLKLQIQRIEDLQDLWREV